MNLFCWLSFLSSSLLFGFTLITFFTIIPQNHEQEDCIWLVSQWKRRQTWSKPHDFIEQKMLFKTQSRVLGNFGSKSRKRENSILSYQSQKWRLSISPWPVFVLETSLYQKIEEIGSPFLHFWPPGVLLKKSNKIEIFTWSLRRSAKISSGDESFQCPMMNKQSREPSGRTDINKTTKQWLYKRILLYTFKR